MSPDEAWTVLAASHTGILTTLRGDGMPITTPVWFVALDGRIYVSGPDHAKRHARLRRDPRASFLVEAGERWSELHAVHLTGEARPVTDPGLLERVQAAMAAKYAGFRTPRQQMPESTQQHYETRLVTIELAPDERVLSWDNRKLGASAPVAGGPTSTPSDA